MRNSTLLALLTGTALFMGCTQQPVTEVDTSAIRLFQKVPPEESGVTFQNTITESLHFNAILFDNMMTGGGVGLLDVNNDGLLDIFLAGNQVEDALYLNKGKLRFENITAKAGIRKRDSWTSGVVIADVNGDGWDDIYLCKHVYDEPERRVNQYYENQKDGTFRERAGELGIADPGYSTIAHFFDMDADGDLDLYVGNQPPSSLFERPKIQGKRDYIYSDRLFRNDGNRFTEVTVASGIMNFCYTLSVNTSDFNGDMLPDIYVAADYEEPDHMYINQGDGTFKDVIHHSMRHLCNFSMGTDIADINNDGLLDIFTADMVAEDHFRNKTNMSGMNPEKFWLLANHGYHYQYMFNALQLNNGNGTYSEIAQLAGVSHTDWSWAAFFMDADHDGWTDLFVGNGQMKDIRNKDFSIMRDAIIKKSPDAEDRLEVLFEISRKAPKKKLQNYFFRNKGNLTYENLATVWGLQDETWSQGAAYGDLDNDGDLDLVINNTNDPALIYANQINDLKVHHYLRIRPKGPQKNLKSINAHVEIQYDGKKQVREIAAVRGYMSSVEPIAHFGLGNHEMVDTVRVIWPGGYSAIRTNVPADQTLEIAYSEAKPISRRKQNPATYFEEIQQPDEFTYAESEYDDYKKEILLPYRMSTLGPAMAHGDVNGDGLDDLYLGGAAGVAGKLLLQNANTTFVEVNIDVFRADAAYEDGGAAFFDADGDRDIDLYVCSGSNEFEEGSLMYQDRLYLNNGKGNFTKARLPEITESTAVVAPLDYDKDGDVDLFIGARQVPGKYGLTPRSLFLQNTNGTYREIGSTVLPDSGRLGMVTDAHWIFPPENQSPQLVVVGEWMPLTVLSWSGERFEKLQIEGTEMTEGMWNRILPVDLDGDGDQDIIAGNCGLNLKYSADPTKPFKAVVNDFDQNGTHDIYLGYYDRYDGRCYPVRGRECSSQQMPFIKMKFTSYADFANATLQEILEGRMDGAQELNCHIFATGIFENTGNGFTFHPFRNEAQFAPVFGIVVSDFNSDQKQDIFLVGNYYHREVETTRSDAGVGTLLLGNGSFDFTCVPPSETGVIANRDARAAALLKTSGQPVLAIANNGSPMQLYSVRRSGSGSLQ